MDIPAAITLEGQQLPVGVAHDAVHEVVVQEAEARDGGLHVEVDGVLPRHAPQVLAVAHPGQRRYHLAVPRHLDVEPAAQHRLSHSLRCKVLSSWDCTDSSGVTPVCLSTHIHLAAF